MNSDVRIVRGVNIATLVFSVMGALIGGALVALLLSASSMLSDPDFFDMFVQELQAESSGSAAWQHIRTFHEASHAAEALEG